MSIISFTVPGVPQGKGRPRVTKNGTFTPQKTRDYEDAIRWCWRGQSGVTISGPLMARITAYFPIPKRTSKAKVEKLLGGYYTHKPDADNIAKAILDALNGLAYKDDSAVQLGHVIKLYTNGLPRVEVVITGVGMND